MTPHPGERLILPTRTPPPEPPPFPIVGALAPLVLAAVLWAATRSPAMLLFAALSPVLAVAGVLDGRLQVRRRTRRAAAAHGVALAAFERELSARRAALGAEAARALPTAATLVRDPASWAARPPTGQLVLGTADLPADPPLVGGAPVDDVERALLQAGRTVPDAPVAVPAETTVALAGPPALTAAAGRAIAVARLRGAGSAAPPMIVPTTDGAPADLVLRIAATGTATVVHASGPAAGIPVHAFTPTFVTVPQHAAVVAGRGGTTMLAALLAEPAAGGLAARFLLGADGGALTVDLVADGPHAVVGGTTGSGKSALLTAWVLALAAAHPPERLVLLLVDCKGGATFDPLAGLPQVAGVVTDLDAAGAARAVASLGAELRRRETVLRAAGAAEVTGTTLPRLVVVVDEYRALLETAPDLAALFADVAARGRSLGVHLVLCTQRPGGAVRGDVLANCGLRVGLRMEAADDSVAILGDGAAARLPREPVGRALVRVGGDRPHPVRVAEVTAAAVRSAVTAIAAAHPGSAVPAPWLPPLPARIVVEPAPGGLVALGALDQPALQRQPPLHWDAVRSPRLLVVGDPGSGRTGALAAAAAGLDAAVCGPGAAALWDALHDDAAPLLVDDLDHRLDRLGPLAAPAVERLALRLRDPAAAPTVTTVRGPSAWSGLPLRGLVGLFDEVLLLRLGLDDHLALGGDRAGWDPGATPGAGRWRGDRAQIAVAPPARAASPPTVPAAQLADGALLISARPIERATRLAAAGLPVVPAAGEGEPASGAVLVGGVADWQQRWRLLAARDRPVLVDGCSAADVRTLLGRATPLPPVDGPDDVVLVPAEGEPRRVRLP